MKEKKIEEMASDLENHTCMSSFQAEITSRTLYILGYRKASEVVNEVFADVFKAIRKYYIEAEHTKSVTCELMLDDLKGDLAELKKKYIGKGTNVTTKESEKDE